MQIMYIVHYFNGTAQDEKNFGMSLSKMIWRTLSCSQITHDSKALNRMDVAIPPAKRPHIKIQKLGIC